MDRQAMQQSRGGRRLALTGLALALAAALAAALAGPGYRLGLWDFRLGFYLLLGAAAAGLVAALLCAAGAIALGARPRRASLAALAGLILGLGVSGLVAAQVARARSVPPIHDISTDTANPPPFVALRETRLASPNGADYGGPRTAALQAEAYPDIATASLPLPPEQAFVAAVAAADALGWQVIAAEPRAGRLEATDTTFWFGFKDDVVVRIIPEPGGSRIDVRSASRVGQSDVGANARRIRRFLERMEARPAAG